MSEATISFSDYDQIRALFGTHDQYLHHVRDAVGVDVVLRGDELRLQGDEAQIRRGLEVFNQLREIIEKKGYLKESEVLSALKMEVDVPESPPAEINLFEKARKVHPRTDGQAEYVRAIRENDLVLCSGPAGSGKTYLAVAMAINALRTEQVRKIVLARPAVEAGEKLGFLPGDVSAKVNPYLRPLLDALNDLLDFEQVRRYLEKDVIEVAPLAFMRGRTLNETFIILDEGQNTTVTQMKMFLTRMGQDSQIVITGDVTQIDLPSHVTGGMTDAMQRLSKVESVGIVKLTGRDIVRHRLVRDIVRAYDADDRGKRPRKK